jgi:hypothetical protein
MAKENGVRLECHIKFNGRNPRHVCSAQALATVDNKYKTSFIALAIEHYMDAHPAGISLSELLSMYRQTERSYQPKIMIAENMQSGRAQSPLATVSPTAAEGHREDSETSGAIDKAMDFYDVLS